MIGKYKVAGRQINAIDVIKENADIPIALQPEDSALFFTEISDQKRSICLERNSVGTQFSSIWR